jgi:septal ring factor EnvC (AmiA/AmiB activator)
LKIDNIYLKNKKMENQSIWAVIITLITVLGSSAAWRFYEKRAMYRERDEDFIRHDCRDRIAKLEALLVQSSQEKDNMRQTILELTEKVAQLTVKVEYLQKENAELMNSMIRKS